jgi:quercetin dioxygenase-like cupin family protein
MIWTTLVFAVIAAPVIVATAVAQQALWPKRTTLQTIDFPPGYETVSVIAELESGNCTGRHTHPGAESAYVLEGEAVATIDGKPDLNVKAGQPLLFAPGAVHNVCNFSGKPFKALAHYIVEKGKPLASPAP